MKFENICNFIDEMEKQVNKAGFGKMACQWRKDLSEAKAELNKVLRNRKISNSDDARELTLQAYCEKYLSNKWV